MSIDRGMDKEDVVCIYSEILLSCKKEWNNAICSNMGGPRSYHAKWSKSESSRQESYDTTYMWNLRYDINECIWNRLTNVKKLWLPKWKEWGRDKTRVLD